MKGNDNVQYENFIYKKCNQEKMSEKKWREVNKLSPILKKRKQMPETENNEIFKQLSPFHQTFSYWQDKDNYYYRMKSWRWKSF